MKFSPIERFGFIVALSPLVPWGMALLAMDRGFAAGILQQAGAGANITGIQNHLRQNNWSAPGLEAPIPPRYFSAR